MRDCDTWLEDRTVEPSGSTGKCRRILRLNLRSPSTRCAVLSPSTLSPGTSQDRDFSASGRKSSPAPR